MNSPDPSVFIAHPLSTAKDPSETSRLVQLFREAFVSRGWHVRPRRDESVDTLNDRLRSHGGTSLVARNVEGIVTSDLLLVVVTEMNETSSIWVEAGMALARDIPLAVVMAAPEVALPFLIRAAVTPSILTLTAEGCQTLAVGDLVDSIIADY